MRAEDLEDCETEGEERDQRQEGGVHQPHGAQIDVAVPEVADHGIRITQRPDEQAEQVGTGGRRPEETPVEEGPDPLHHPRSVQGNIPRMTHPSGYPQRIVCLTEETTETLYLLEEDWRIVGISGFTVRPPRARKEKPRVSAFTSAKIGRIIDLQPDLVLGFSDLQADIAAELVRAGIEVHVFNHRSVAEILRTVAVIGGMIGCEAKATALVAQLSAGLDAVRARAAALPGRPRVY